MDEVQIYIDNAIADLLPHGGGGRITEHRLRHVMERLAQQAHRAGFGEALGELRDANEAAEFWGVSRRRAQAHIRHLHERFGVGAKIGGVWIVTTDEMSRNAPGDPGRPPETH